MNKGLNILKHYGLKVKDQLSIGFVNLNAQIIKKNRNFMLVKVISSGHLENNKGVHLKNRVIGNFLGIDDLGQMIIKDKTNNSLNISSGTFIPINQ